MYYLLEVGADLSVTDLDNNTPLDIALEEQNDKIIEIINEFIQKNNINPNDISNKNKFS